MIKKKWIRQPQTVLPIAIPEIIVSTVPAELIQSNGEADFSPIKGTGLLYMTNTNNDVFMNIADQQYYVLLSGRWYKSASLKGPWTYTPSNKLPDDFAKIPDDSEKARCIIECGWYIPGAGCCNGCTNSANGQSG